MTESLVKVDQRLFACIHYHHTNLITISIMLSAEDQVSYAMTERYFQVRGLKGDMADVDLDAIEAWVSEYFDVALDERITATPIKITA
jgi:hypothetical protein